VNLDRVRQPEMVFDEGVRAGGRTNFGRRLVVIGVFMTAVGACGSGHQTLGNGHPRPIDLHVGTPGQSSLPTASAPGPLAPGAYYTSVFRPAVRFNVSDGWTMRTESPQVLSFPRPGGRVGCGDHAAVAVS
jgi:hypothetical protein